MRALDRRERIAAAVWVVIAIAAWNGVYDILMTRGVKDYLLRNALHLAGRGPAVSMTERMDAAVAEAFWLATLAASILLLAGLWTVRLLARRP
jgi:hypothetical protein